MLITMDEFEQDTRTASDKDRAWRRAFGLRLRAIRHLLGLELKDWADQVDIGMEVLKKYESGRSYPPP